MDVPATNGTINHIIRQILLNNAPGERIILKIGTCTLLCNDPAECNEFGSMVKVSEALQCLLHAKE